MNNTNKISVLYMERPSKKRSTVSSAKPNDKSVLFTIGRMNPPTPGHKKLVQQMIVDALRNDIHVVFVNLTSTTGLNNEGKVNPLACKDKKRIVYKMIEQIKEELGSEHDIESLQVIVNCADDEDIQHPEKPNQITDMLIGMFKKLKMIYNEEIMPDRINFRLYLGEKDYGKFDWIERMFPFNDTKNDVKFDLKSIKVKRPPGDMSATYLRNLTIRDDDKFMQAMIDLSVEQGKELTGKELDQLASLDRQSVFVQEMKKVGLDDSEAGQLFVDIQTEIEKYRDKKNTKTTTRKQRGGKRSSKRSKKRSDRKKSNKRISKKRRT